MEELYEEGVGKKGGYSVAASDNNRSRLL